MPVVNVNKKRKIDLNVRPDILCTELALRGRGRQQLNSEQIALQYLSDEEYRRILAESNYIRL
jgi:hypothetical protein